MDTSERIKRLVFEVHSLSQVETEEIFKIIHQSKCNYTRNNNGIFVNLAWLHEDTLLQLENYVRFCTKSKKELTKYESLCDVLNHKMYEYGHDPVPLKHKDVHIVSQGGNSTVSGTGYAGTENNNERTTSFSRMSSSLRYYLLKKRYSKQQTQSNSSNDYLKKEDYVIV